MKYLSIIFISLFLLSCSSTHLVENWKNPDIEVYYPTKVLVVGMTPNIEARKKFEEQLKEEYEARGVEVVMSLELFKPSLRTEKMTKEELKVLENDLINDGFDTVLFTKVMGVEDKIAYKKNYRKYDETFIEFEEDYLRYQDIYYNPNYYEEYTVYHAETSMFCICPTKDRELIWKGYIDIVDPQSINETVNDYVKLVVLVLEEQQLLTPKVLEEKESKTEEAIQ